MKPIKQIFLVGHCGFDSSMLHRAVEQVVEDATEDASVSQARSRDDIEALGGDALLLINRKLESGFEARTGQELIRELAGQDDPPVMMLVSNQSEAQQEAIEAGARPGFGKADVDDPATQARLREMIEGVAATAE